ncbi:phosphoenolpyruvate synthase [Sphingomonas limnosediminicola]|uniref:Phosphoenolpyruvate synthase n=1 Tax=Sphingomonas limnosediminicola TaxID=940133 RepID=A0ABP7LX25_9SPHN
MNEYIFNLADVGMGEVPLVGGKNASSGELIRALSTVGIRVPRGFAVSAAGYRDLISANKLRDPIARALSALRKSETSLSAAGARIRELVGNATIPTDLAADILSAYRKLGAATGEANPAVAVRSSATAEDLPEASFAGQQESYLNVVGEEQLLGACRSCYASLFTDRAIAYRQAKGIDDLAVALSIGVQQMVRSDIGSSGVMFSLDPDSGFPRVVVINAAWGLGEAIVQGAVDPDKYVVFKPLMKTSGSLPLIEKRRGGKKLKVILDKTGGTKTVDTLVDEQQSWVLSDADLSELSRWALLVEEHYGRPMDMEWAKDGVTGELFMVQARPETVQSGAGSHLIQYKVRSKGNCLLEGQAVGTSIASGEACVIANAAKIERFKEGSILVTRRTDPDWTPIMKRAAAIVTEHGGTTSHAAIISRELGIPAIVGVEGAASMLNSGQEITVSCAEGERGKIYKGRIDFTREEIDPAKLPTSKTALMVNLADPDQAFRSWQLPARGVGLARMEFIISNLLRVHPMALVHPERISDEDRQTIAELSIGYATPREFFVDNLARGIAKLAVPYHPEIAIVRLSDFKTNEYAHLIGGATFEPGEENPMLGFRGASRYYDERYRDGFALECEALKRARQMLGFKNIAVMIPFCRTPTEADRVLEVMAEEGLRRGEAGLQVYMMCEIPSNVILAREFASRFDGFSIGSNDLTQLVLGVDRDSDILAKLFDERNEAVTRSIASVIADAHAAGIKIGICGEAPSNDPEFADFLVRCGIDSMSLNPDSFVRTLKSVTAAETGALSGLAAQRPIQKPCLEKVAIIG